MEYHKNKLMEALNLIDEQAEQMGGSREECEERAKAYVSLFNFIKANTEKKCNRCDGEMDASHKCL